MIRKTKNSLFIIIEALLKGFDETIHFENLDEEWKSVQKLTEKLFRLFRDLSESSEAANEKLQAEAYVRKSLANISLKQSKS